MKSTPIKLALHLLGPLVTDVEIIDRTTALVAIPDLDAMRRGIERVERALGVPVQCLAEAGGKCRLIVSSEVA